MKFTRLICVLSFSATLLGCGGSDNEKAFEEVAHHDTELISEPQISTEALVDIINSIPPPIELSVLIKEVGGPYSKGILNPTDNSSKYNTNMKANNEDKDSSNKGFNGG